MSEPRDLEAAYRAAQGDDEAARARRRAAVLAAVNGEAAAAPAASNDSHWRRLPRWGGGVAVLFIGVMSGLLLRQTPQEAVEPEARAPAAVVLALPQASQSQEVQEAQQAIPAKIQAAAPNTAPPRVMHTAPMRPRLATARAPQGILPVPAEPAPTEAPADQADAARREAVVPAPMPAAAPAPMPAPMPAPVPAPVPAPMPVFAPAPPAPVAALPARAVATRAGSSAPLAAGVGSSAVDLPIDADGRSPLILAVRAGDLARVRALIQQGANRELRDRFGKRAVDYALDAGQGDILEALQPR